MQRQLSDELQAVFKKMGKEIQSKPGGLTHEHKVSLDRVEAAKRLPQKELMLLVDRVTYLDPEANLIISEYSTNTERAQTILAGHFPGYPLFPGVLQTEAIAQTGFILHSCMNQVTENIEGIGLSHLSGSRFIRPIEPPEPFEMRVKVFSDGLFIDLIGQCIQHGKICSVCAATGTELK